jgi:hypothetical protein
MPHVLVRGLFLLAWYVKDLVLDSMGCTSAAVDNLF